MAPKAKNTGESVAPLSGLFSNFVATVEKIDEQQRGWVLIEFLVQSTKMHFAPGNVQFAT